MRQQPLTATLSPSERSEAKGTPESVSLAPPREGEREATLAVDSTMPVNIGLRGTGGVGAQPELVGEWGAGVGRADFLSG